MAGQEFGGVYLKTVRVLCLALAMLMVVAAFSGLASVAGRPAMEPYIADVVKKDIGPEVRAQRPMGEMVSEAVEQFSRNSVQSDVHEVGETELFYTSGYGAQSFMDFELRGRGGASARSGSQLTVTSRPGTPGTTAFRSPMPRSRP